LAGPLFQGGRLKSEYRTALAQRDEAQLLYEKSVTQAFGEVSTALSAHQLLAQSIKEQNRSVTAYQDSVRLSTLRYDSGLASYFEVLDSKMDLFPAQTALVLYDLDRKVALVELYKALGGGWKLSDAEWLNKTASTTPAHP
jgi:multidrug efflux system outer membrane protein